MSAVQASWIVPTLTCNSVYTTVSIWIGLDGWGNNVVEQGGTAAACENGSPVYGAGWEMYPTNPTGIEEFVVGPGDHITASVVYSPTTMIYTISLKDSTNGRSFTETQKCASDLTCPRSSAEWIVEDPGGGVGPLAEYTPVEFTSASATNTAGKDGPISDTLWQNSAIEMTKSPRGIRAKVSKLQSNGTQFIDTWKHN
jgi:Peptidase A4 family